MIFCWMSSMPSRTIRRLPEVSVTTVSGVSSMCSMRSQFTITGWPLSRVSTIMSTPLQERSPGTIVPGLLRRVVGGDGVLAPPPHTAHFLVDGTPCYARPGLVLGGAQVDERDQVLIRRRDAARIRFERALRDDELGELVR